MQWVYTLLSSVVVVNTYQLSTANQFQINIIMCMVISEHIPSLLSHVKYFLHICIKMPYCTENQGPQLTPFKHLAQNLNFLWALLN